MLKSGGKFSYPKEIFILNNNQENEGKTQFANPRNAAAGSLRQLDPPSQQNDHFQYTATTSGIIKDNSFKTHVEFLDALKMWGFLLSLYKNSEDDKGIVTYHNDLENQRDNIPYEIDGNSIQD